MSKSLFGTDYVLDDPARLAWLPLICLQDHHQSCIAARAAVHWLDAPYDALAASMLLIAPTRKLLQAGGLRIGLSAEAVRADHSAWRHALAARSGGASTLAEAVHATRTFIYSALYRDAARVLA